ncbi:MAG: carbon dioxide concentrating mechanism protein CcmL [Planctomycetaceae bacterium]|nr:carbon dioxide concentrating mechanism protein CcmL [Planctomycetaceae bacterium]
MRIMECIGRVTLSKWHPSLTGASWKLAVPLTHDGLKGKASGRTEPIVIFDELGAGNGSLMAVSESAEATAPFHPSVKPIDAYNAAILDTVNLD